MDTITGNVYVGDWGNHTVRKVTPNGNITTLAGLAGARGSADGVGTAARFARPVGVAVDNIGNVYVADCGNSTIRKIDSNGNVTTLAGLAGTTGSADGVGESARFNSAEGVAVDNAGNVYVVDTQNHTLRKITQNGNVTTLAGLVGGNDSIDGIGSNARFDEPYGVAVGSNGHVYVGDFAKHTVRECIQIVATPIFSPAGGAYPIAQSVTILCATSNASIYYTTNGSTPTTSSAQHTSDIVVSETTTIKAIAAKDGMANSSVASAMYTIEQSTPLITSALTVTATQGTPFSYQIIASGMAPITFTATGLSDWLSLSGNTISGVPTVIGVFDIVLTATNSAGFDSKTLILTVSQPTEKKGSSGDGCGMMGCMGLLLALSAAGIAFCRNHA